MYYRLINNKVYSPKACEINIVHHCNLSCRSCSNLAPALGKHFEDPSQVFNDCSILSKYYRPSSIKLIGGEPLLHPNLIEIIDAIRSSGISNYIQVITNGQLLAKMPALFWDKIDELHISIYPERGINPEDLKAFARTAKSYNVAFQYFYFDRFQESYSEIGTTNSELVRRIYATCKLAHTWKCHTISKGYFYKCPRSLFLAKLLNRDELKSERDSIQIADYPEFAKDLLTYLESPAPLTSCYYCLGSVGKLFAHEQKPHSKWRSLQDIPSEELLDFEELSTLEKNLHAQNSCIRKRSPLSKVIDRVQRGQRNLAKQLNRQTTKPNKR